jgi:hypothetical protein
MQSLTTVGIAAMLHMGAVVTALDIMGCKPCIVASVALRATAMSAAMSLDLTSPLKLIGDGITFNLDFKKRNRAVDNPLVKTSAT